MSDSTKGTGVALTARRGGCAGGCIVVAIIAVVLLVAGGIFVATQWRGWVVGAAEQAMDAFLGEIDVDAGQKQRMDELVDAVLVDFENKQFPFEKLETLGQSFEASPLIPMGAMLVVEASYVTPREWPAEEKEAARRTLERFTRGIVDETIPQQRLDDVLAPISRPAGDTSGGDSSSTSVTFNEVELKAPSEVTDAELREFLVLVKAEADRVDVPDEPYDIDLAAELERVIVEGLGTPLPPATRAVIERRRTSVDPAEPVDPADDPAGDPSGDPDPASGGGG